MQRIEKEALVHDAADEQSEMMENEYLPFTLFHYPLAWAIARVDKRFSLPGLFVGITMPDIEVPFLILFFGDVLPNQYVLHSLVQTMTLGLVLSVLAVRFLYPPVISRIFGVNRQGLDERCSVSPALILSCAVGLVGHLLLDYPMHYYNHILWPFVDPNTLVGPLVLILSFEGDLDLGYIRANIITNIIMILLFALIVMRIRGSRFWERFWLGESENPAESDAELPKME
ncbi:MAG: hypothetical protein ACW99U_02265 [Candidatus Thorarchaeota archaeon]